MLDATMQLMTATTNYDDASYKLVQAAMARFKADPTAENKAKFQRIYTAWLAVCEATSELLQSTI